MTYLSIQPNSTNARVQALYNTITSRLATFGPTAEVGPIVVEAHADHYLRVVPPGMPESCQAPRVSASDDGVRALTDEEIADYRYRGFLGGDPDLAYGALIPNLLRRLEMEDLLGDEEDLEAANTSSRKYEAYVVVANGDVHHIDCRNGGCILNGYSVPGTPREACASVFTTITQ